MQAKQTIARSRIRIPVSGRDTGARESPPVEASFMAAKVAAPAAPGPTDSRGETADRPLRDGVHSAFLIAAICAT